jgi:hypothetical protein
MKTKRAATLSRAAAQATAAPKRKAVELLGSGALDKPASRGQATDQPSERRSEGHGATGEQAAQSSRQLGSAEGRLAYATVLAGVASLQERSGQAKPSQSVNRGRRLAQSASRRPPVCLPYLRIIALLGFITDT